MLKGGQIELGNCGLITGAFSSDTTISTPVAINKGGTGQTTAQAALDALAAASGSLVQGDIFIVDSNTNVIRLARGADDTILKMSGSNPNWETESAGASLSGDNTWTGVNNFQDQVTFAGTFSTWQTANKTIASAKITMTTNLGIVDTEGSASTDDLNEAEGVPANAMFSLRASSAARTVVIKDTTGSVQFLGSGDFSMDNSQDSCTWCNFDGTHNYQIAESDNAS